MFISLIDGSLLWQFKHDVLLLLFSFFILSDAITWRSWIIHRLFSHFFYFWSLFRISSFILHWDFWYRVRLMQFWIISLGVLSWRHRVKRSCFVVRRHEFGNQLNLFLLRRGVLKIAEIIFRLSKHLFRIRVDDHARLGSLFDSWALFNFKF